MYGYYHIGLIEWYAQTPVNRLTVYMLYSHMCNKYSENRTDGAYDLVYRTYSFDRQRWNKHVNGLIDHS